MDYKDQHKRERMIEALAKDWKYDRKILEDAYDVVGDYDLANEIISYMDSERMETVIEALEEMFEFGSKFYWNTWISEEDCDAVVLSNLRNL